jgi:hypothetical protein
VFVAIGAAGTVVGHTMVRSECGEATGPAPVGLFATTYVVPGARRSGIASVLLHRGEQWMREHGLSTAMTFTNPSNTKLRALYTRHCYVWDNSQHLGASVQETRLISSRAANVRFPECQVVGSIESRARSPATPPRDCPSGTAGTGRSARR